MIDPVLKKLPVAALLAAVLVGALAASASASAPEVETKPATNLTALTANLNAVIHTNGGDDTVYAFGYATQEFFEKGGQYDHFITYKEAPEGATVSVSEPIDELEPSTTYHFKVAVISSGGLAEGKDLTFTTDYLHRPRFTADEYPATIEADAGSSAVNVLKLGSSVRCGENHFEAVTGEDTASMSLSATYGNCKFGTQSATVSMNSCSYVYNVANAGPPYSGTVDIACAQEGDAIEISIPGISCTLKVHAQSPNSSVSYENDNQGENTTVQVSADADEVDVETINPKGNYFCGLLEAEGDGEFDALFAAEALNSAESQVDLRMTGNEVGGLYVVGEASESESEQPRFTADEYPATIEADAGSSAVNVLKLGSSVRCGENHFEAVTGEDTASMSLSATYGNCKFGTQSATVSMNSCSYVYNVANAGPPYSGTVDIACAQEGDAIEISIPGISCTLKVHAQSPNSSVSYENDGYDGNGPAVQAVAGAEGVTVEVINPAENYFCGLLESEGNGELDSDLLLDLSH